MKIIEVYLKISDEIKDCMQQGLEFEAARRRAYEKYKMELEVIKGERNSSKNKWYLLNC